MPDEKDLEKTVLLLESTMGLLDDILSRLAAVGAMLQTNDVGAIFSLDTVVREMKHVILNQSFFFLVFYFLTFITTNRFWMDLQSK